MFTKNEIIGEISNVQRENAAFWSAFDAAAFHAPLGDAWSPAENVRHLILSMRAVAKGLSMPTLALWWKFGTSRKPSQSYEEVRDRYVAIPEKKAGRFTPRPEDQQQAPGVLLAKLDDAHRELVTALARWSERDLDRYRMPHPILGKLTVREMLFFTIYHSRHHIAGVQRRRV